VAKKLARREQPARSGADDQNICASGAEVAAEPVEVGHRGDP
jgi:hypothetical protein